jgi:hypothetical protein
LVEQIVECRQMAFDEIHDVNVVAHAGAVGRRIVVAKNTQLPAFACRHLGHVGQEVVRNAIRFLADQAAGVRADGIEIAQARDSPLLIGLRQVGQNVFDHQLAGAVGVGRRAREIFPDGHRRRVAIDRRRGAEDQRFHRAFGHHFAEADRAADIAVVVTQGLSDRFSDRFQAGEMNHRVDRRGGKDAPQERSVADIALEKDRPLAR